MMSETFRNVDIVARLQDARFAVVMPDTGERIPDVLARLTRAVQSFHLEGADGSSLLVRLAVGTCTYPTEAATVPEMFDHAERLTILEP